MDGTDKSLKILLLEDSDFDALLVIRVLEKRWEGLSCHRVWDRDAMVEALNGQQWDLIISDYHMPNFNSLDVLEVYRAFRLDIPVLVVSGDDREDVAIEAKRAGAHDYIRKDDMSSLVLAIERELVSAGSSKL